jgi:hypothetical protein
VLCAFIQQLELCVKYVDESNMGPLAKALQELFARGVGLPTKCGTAHMISSLTMVVSDVFSPLSMLLRGRSALGMM